MENTIEALDRKAFLAEYLTKHLQSETRKFYRNFKMTYPDLVEDDLSTILLVGISKFHSVCVRDHICENHLEAFLKNHAEEILHDFFYPDNVNNRSNQ